MSASNVLKPVDYEPLASDPDELRWRNTARWARHAHGPGRTAERATPSVASGRSARRAGSSLGPGREMTTSFVIDNRHDRLVDQITGFLSESSSAKFAVGYFFLSGFEASVKAWTISPSFVCSSATRQIVRRSSNSARRTSVSISCPTTSTRSSLLAGQIASGEQWPQPKTSVTRSA